MLLAGSSCPPCASVLPRWPLGRLLQADRCGPWRGSSVAAASFPRRAGTHVGAGPTNLQHRPVAEPRLQADWLRRRGCAGGPPVWSSARLSPYKRGQGGGGTGGTLQRGEKRARGLKFQQRKMLGTNRKYCFLARQSFVRTVEIMFSRCSVLPS